MDFEKFAFKKLQKLHTGPYIYNQPQIYFGFWGVQYDSDSILFKFFFCGIHLHVYGKYENNGSSCINMYSVHCYFSLEYLACQQFTSPALQRHNQKAVQLPTIVADLELITDLRDRSFSSHSLQRWRWRLYGHRYKHRYQH